MKQLNTIERNGQVFKFYQFSDYVAIYKRIGDGEKFIGKASNYDWAIDFAECYPIDVDQSIIDDAKAILADKPSGNPVAVFDWQDDSRYYARI